MKQVSTAKIVSFAILVLIGCHIAYYWQRLPEEMVTHFDANWEPNGWMSRDMFIFTYIGIVALVGLSFLGSVMVLDKIPRKWINMPHKDYWLHPDRREATMRYLSEATIRMNNVTMVLIVAIMHMTIDFNLTGERIDSGTFWILLAVYLAYMALWIIMFYGKYGRKPEGEDERPDVNVND